MNIKDWSTKDLLSLSGVLFDIKQLILYCKEGELVVYPSDEHLNKAPSESSLSSAEQRFFVFTIQGEGAIKVLYEHTMGKRETPYRWNIEGTISRLNELDDQINKIYIEKLGKEAPLLIQPESIRIGIAVADLKSKFQEIQHERVDDKFYLKLANYGKYLNDNNYIFNPLFLSLYSESQDQINHFKKVWMPFFDQWKLLAKDLLKIADKNGVVDEGPTENEINCMRESLNNSNPLYYMDDYPSHYGLYIKIIWKLDKLGKRGLIAKNHLVGDSTTVKLHAEYEKIEDEWDRYIKIRDLSTWWAHYQITRLTNGVLGDEAEKHRYFDKNRIVDGLYAEEFNNIIRGNDADLIFLKRHNYEEWINRLHNYLIPRIEAINRGPGINNIEVNSTDIANTNISPKSEEGNIQGLSKLDLFSEDDLVECCGLKYSLTECKLGFKDGKPAKVSPETREIKFFLTLFKRKGEVVDYKDIVRAVGGDFYKNLTDNGKVSHEDIKNMDCSNEASLLRRDFRVFALNQGMSTNDFENMIENVVKKGYKLNCHDRG